MKTALILLAVWGCITPACGVEEDISSGQAFLAAFPGKDTLLIQSPTLATQDLGLTVWSQSLLGGSSDLFYLSLDVAVRVNSQALKIFGTIWFVTRFPPSFAIEEQGVVGQGDKQLPTDARAIWGPLRDIEGKNLEYVLNVWRGTDPKDGRRTFAYVASVRRVGEGKDAWTPFLAGASKPFEDDGASPPRGLVELDLDKLQSADPSVEDVGQVTYAYEIGAGYHVVAAVGVGVWSDSSRSATTDATYLYGRTVKGETFLEFDTQLNLNLATGEALEHLHVISGCGDQWEGRSDAQADGGDLGSTTAQLTECWGENQLLTFIHFLQGSTELTEGDEKSCFAAEPIDTPDIDYTAIRDEFDF